jgi:hypothetical protein
MNTLLHMIVDLQSIKENNNSIRILKANQWIHFEQSNKHLKETIIYIYNIILKANQWIHYE